MYCMNCGQYLSDDSKFCTFCGSSASGPASNKKASQNQGSFKNQPFSSGQVSKSPRIGFSNKINDPRFKKYKKQRNIWAGVFGLFLAVLAPVGFYIYGEVSSEINNPEAIYIGLILSVMFILISILTIFNQTYLKKSWEGVVIDKKEKWEMGGSEEADTKKYTIVIRKDSGKKYKDVYYDNPLVYNYLNIGDKIKRHKGFDGYEKYNKTNDTYILCIACLRKNDINNDVCRLCKCPLLK